MISQLCRKPACLTPMVFSPLVNKMSMIFVAIIRNQSALCPMGLLDQTPKLAAAVEANASFGVATFSSALLCTVGITLGYVWDSAWMAPRSMLFQLTGCISRKVPDKERVAETSPSTSNEGPTLADRAIIRQLMRPKAVHTNLRPAPAKTAKGRRLGL